ncbi:hypothetical protein POTOM_003638 [Populus tomentosa]|uniref:Uncharacterized protein n=1 Tax=Populus tomentosa TaxID=118781 RepID=A0A8X8D4Z3_POPTO|nr:hypothetical protein POTOM_003638 [Populus tomentosa]
MGQKLARGPLPLDEAWGMQPCQLEISRKYESPFSMQPHINFIIKDLMAGSAQFEQLKLNNAAKSFQRMMVPFVCTLLYYVIIASIRTVGCPLLANDRIIDNDFQISKLGFHSFFVSQSSSLLVRITFNDISWYEEAMAGIHDLGVFNSVRPSWQFALFKLLPVHLKLEWSVPV